jgi:hypothetical protein
MFRELVTAIVPHMALVNVLQRWNEITRSLAESRRKRRRQSLS